jgi:hypothetical protein
MIVINIKQDYFRASDYKTESNIVLNTDDILINIHRDHMQYNTMIV